MNYAAILGACFVGFATLAFGGGPVPKGPVAPWDEAADTQAKDGQEGKAREGVAFPNFKPSEFPFVTTLPDDGTDKGGGWQVAKVNLEFTRISLPFTVITWWCPFSVQMPLRTEVMGKVDATRAAMLSVEITNAVSPTMDYKLPQGIFCQRFMTSVDAAFKAKYPLLGASAMK
jgi:hypothetical protein